MTFVASESRAASVAQGYGYTAPDDPALDTMHFGEFQHGLADGYADGRSALAEGTSEDTVKAVGDTHHALGQHNRWLLPATPTEHQFKARRAVARHEGYAEGIHKAVVEHANADDREATQQQLTENVNNGTRNWDKWHEEHPYIEHDRPKAAKNQSAVDAMKEALGFGNSNKNLAKSSVSPMPGKGKKVAYKPDPYAKYPAVYGHHEDLGPAHGKQVEALTKQRDALYQALSAVDHKNHLPGLPAWKQIKGDKTMAYRNEDPHAKGGAFGELTPGKARYGGVMFSKDGRVLLREPTNHFGGVHWSFPKGHPEPGEHPVDSAVRETVEETGAMPAVVGHVPGGFGGSSTGSVNHFYLMHDSEARHPELMNGESQDFRWATPKEAHALISTSTDVGTRDRDRQTLRAAVAAHEALTGVHHPDELPPPETDITPKPKYVTSTSAHPMGFQGHGKSEMFPGESMLYDHTFDPYAPPPKAQPKGKPSKASARQKWMKDLKASTSPKYKVPKLGFGKPKRSIDDLETRDWAKWRLEHPYIRKGRSHQDKDVITNAHAAAEKLTPGKAFTGNGKMTDEDYELHRQHVEYETVRHGAMDLQRSPYSTHISEDRVRGVEGLYTPSRRAQHEAILGEILQSAQSVPNEHRAIIMGGLGGAGKSTILRTNAEDPHSTAAKLSVKYASYAKKDDPAHHIRKGDGIGEPTNFVTVNPDAIKEEMARRHMAPQIDHLSPMEAAGPFAHEEASQLAEELGQRLTAEGKNVIWDITLNSVKSGDKRVNPLHNTPSPYHVSGVFVDVSRRTSIKNAEQRHRSGQQAYAHGQGLGGRFVPSDLLRHAVDPEGKYQSANRAAFEKLKAKGTFDHTITVNNEGYKGEILSETGKALQRRAMGLPDETLTTDITDLIKAYRAGTVSREDLVNDLSRRDYKEPIHLSEPGKSMYDAEDVDWHEPGTWGEVAQAHNFGLLTHDEYGEIADKAYQNHTEGEDGQRDWAVWDAEHQGSQRGHGIDDALADARGNKLSLADVSLRSGQARKTSLMFPSGSNERHYHEGRSAGYAHHLAGMVSARSTSPGSPKQFTQTLQSAFAKATQRKLARVQAHNFSTSTSLATRQDPTVLETRDWTKWHEEHPYIDDDSGEESPHAEHYKLAGAKAYEEAKAAYDKTVVQLKAKRSTFYAKAKKAKLNGDGKLQAEHLGRAHAYGVVVKERQEAGQLEAMAKAGDSGILAGSTGKQAVTWQDLKPGDTIFWNGVQETIAKVEPSTTTSDKNGKPYIKATFAGGASFDHLPSFTLPYQEKITTGPSLSGAAEGTKMSGHIGKIDFSTSGKLPNSDSELAGATKISGPKGSNPAQWYQLPDGSKVIVKEAPDAEHAYNEVAVGETYKAAGFEVPETGVLKHDNGKWAVVSKQIPGLQKWTGSNEQKADARKGFGLDALTSNYDALGLVDDNSLVDPKTGNVVRIDQGGGGFYRAQGAPKLSFKAHGWADDPKGADYNTLADPAVNSQMRFYGDPEKGSLYQHHSQDLTASLNQAATLDLTKVDDAMKAKGIPQDFRQKYLGVLQSRQEHLSEQLGNVPSEKVGTDGKLHNPYPATGLATEYHQWQSAHDFAYKYAYTGNHSIAQDNASAKGIAAAGVVEPDYPNDLHHTESEAGVAGLVAGYKNHASDLAHAQVVAPSASPAPGPHLTTSVEEGVFKKQAADFPEKYASGYAKADLKPADPQQYIMNLESSMQNANLGSDSVALFAGAIAHVLDDANGTDRHSPEKMKAEPRTAGWDQKVIDALEGLGKLMTEPGWAAGGKQPIPSAAPAAIENHPDYKAGHAEATAQIAKLGIDKQAALDMHTTLTKSTTPFGKGMAAAYKEHTEPPKPKYAQVMSQDVQPGDKITVPSMGGAFNNPEKPMTVQSVSNPHTDEYNLTVSGPTINPNMLLTFGANEPVNHHGTGTITPSAAPSNPSVVPSASKGQKTKTQVMAKNLKAGDLVEHNGIVVKVSHVGLNGLIKGDQVKPDSGGELHYPNGDIQVSWMVQGPTTKQTKLNTDHPLIAAKWTGGAAAPIPASTGNVHIGSLELSHENAVKLKQEMEAHLDSSGDPFNTLHHYGNTTGITDVAGQPIPYAEDIGIDLSGPGQDNDKKFLAQLNAALGERTGPTSSKVEESASPAPVAPEPSGPLTSSVTDEVLAFKADKSPASYATGYAQAVTALGGKPQGVQKATLGAYEAKWNGTSATQEKGFYSGAIGAALDLHNGTDTHKPPPVITSESKAPTIPKEYAPKKPVDTMPNEPAEGGGVNYAPQYVLGYQQVMEQVAKGNRTPLDMHTSIDIYWENHKDDTYGMGTTGGVKGLVDGGKAALADLAAGKELKTPTTGKVAAHNATASHKALVLNTSGYNFSGQDSFSKQQANKLIPGDTIAVKTTKSYSYSQSLPKIKQQVVGLESNKKDSSLVDIHTVDKEGKTHKWTIGQEQNVSFIGKNGQAGEPNGETSATPLTLPKPIQPYEGQIPTGEAPADFVAAYHAAEKLENNKVIGVVPSKAVVPDESLRTYDAFKLAKEKALEHAETMSAADSLKAAEVQKERQAKSISAAEQAEHLGAHEGFTEAATKSAPTAAVMGDTAEMTAEQLQETNAYKTAQIEIAHEIQNDATSRALYQKAGELKDHADPEHQARALAYQQAAEKLDFEEGEMPTVVVGHDHPPLTEAEVASMKALAAPQGGDHGGDLEQWAYNVGRALGINAGNHAAENQGAQASDLVAAAQAHDKLAAETHGLVSRKHSGIAHVLYRVAEAKQEGGAALTTSAKDNSPKPDVKYHEPGSVAAAVQGTKYTIKTNFTSQETDAIHSWTGPSRFGGGYTTHTSDSFYTNIQRIMAGMEPHGQGASEAKAFVHAAATKSVPSKQTIYRGTHAGEFTQGQLSKWKTSLAEGKNLDVSIPMMSSSYSDSMGYTADSKILYVIDPGAMTLDIGTKSSHTSEIETIPGGLFEIYKIAPYPNRPGQTAIYMRQKVHYPQ